MLNLSVRDKKLLAIFLKNNISHINNLDLSSNKLGSDFFNFTNTKFCIISKKIS